MNTQTRMQNWMRFFMATGWTVLAIISTIRLVGHGGKGDMAWLPYILPIISTIYAVVSWYRFIRLWPRK